jgi:hypothetical protein
MSVVRIAVLENQNGNRAGDPPYRIRPAWNGRRTRAGRRPFMRTGMGWIRTIPVLVVASAGTGWAQAPDEPASLTLYSGARARFVTTEQPHVVQKGTLLHGDATTLTLLGRDGREVHLPLSSLTRLDLALERKNHAWTGVLLGAVAGAGIGSVDTVDPLDCDDSSGNFCSRAEAVGVCAVAFAVVGAVVGSQIHTDRWTRISVGDSRPAPTPARGGPALVSFAIRVRF